MRYSLFKGDLNPNITTEELKCFIAILIVSGYTSTPGKRYYWCQGDDVRNYAIYNAMRRNRFETIMKYIHCADNLNLQPNDKFAKIRPLSELLRKKFLRHYVPTPSLSHDETMVEYYGRHGCKQCIRNKPIRFGYKVWCVNSENGYLVNFDMYQGKSLNKDSEIQKLVGKSGSTVLHLLQELPESKKCLPYTLYFDNLFSSFELLVQLKEIGYHATGTVRNNRLGSCPVIPIDSMKKKPRGSISFSTDVSNNIQVCRWTDNSVVTLLSNCHGIEPVTKVKRYSNKIKQIIDIECPNIVRAYNKRMGSTDVFNKDTNRLRIGIRGKKWWWALFTWLIDTSIVNAWKLSADSMTQLQFRREIVSVYFGKYSFPPTTAGRPSSSFSRAKDSLRYDKMDHLVVSTRKRRRCMGELCTKRPFTECEKCNVGLCTDCFRQYHTK